MKKSILLAVFLGGVISAAQARLEPMANDELQGVDGQASAATVNWLFSLNHVRTPDPLLPLDRTKDKFEFDTTTCADLRYCRLALSYNNRYHDGSYIDRNGVIYNAAGTVITAAAHAGRKQWLVFKGMQGTIQIQDMQLDGADLLYRDDANVQQIKAALQLTFDAAKPIKIRNFGFNALAVETDTQREKNADGTVNLSNTPGYLAMGSGGAGIYTYTNGLYDYSGGGLPAGYGVNSFDHGRETGFTGLMMNGNLALQGTLKVFSCDGSMKRC